MKITDIKLERSIVPVKHQFVWRKGLPGSGAQHDQLKITVETDEGISGVAYAAHGAVMQEIIEQRIKPDLLGLDPLMKEYLWHRVWELDRIEEIPIYGLGLIDIALGGHVKGLFGPGPNRDLWLRPPANVALEDLSGQGTHFTFRVNARYHFAPASHPTYPKWLDTSANKLPALCRGIREGLSELTTRNSSSPLRPVL